MRSLILSAVLGLGSVGVLTVTPDDAQARPWRVGASSYYYGPYYGGPSYYGGYAYAPPAGYYAAPFGRAAVGVVPSPSGASFYYSPGVAYYGTPAPATYYYGQSYTGFYAPGYYYRR